MHTSLVIMKVSVYPSANLSTDVLVLTAGQVQPALNIHALLIPVEKVHVSSMRLLSCITHVLVSQSFVGTTALSTTTLVFLLTHVTTMEPVPTVLVKSTHVPVSKGILGTTAPIILVTIHHVTKEAV